MSCKNRKCRKWNKCKYKEIKATFIAMEKLQAQIETALNKLYSNEYFLIEHSVHEIAIVSHFFRYFFK